MWIHQQETFKIGTLGCPDCYQAFGDAILDSLVKMHRGVEHVGKSSENRSAGLLRAGGRSPQKALDQAVAEENYEEAARLRDAIGALPDQVSMVQAERIPKLFLSVSLGVWLSVFGLCGSLVSENSKTWHEADGYRWRALTVSESNQVGFVPMTDGGSGVGRIFNALSDQRAAENQIRLLGSGVALGDVDGDGDVDLYCACLEGIMSYS